MVASERGWDLPAFLEVDPRLWSAFMVDAGHNCILATQLWWTAYCSIYNKNAEDIFGDMHGGRFQEEVISRAKADMWMFDLGCTDGDAQALRESEDPAFIEAYQALHYNLCGNYIIIGYGPDDILPIPNL
jgi:hypothetical protein